MMIEIQNPLGGVASGGCAIIQGFGGRPEVYARFGLRGHNGLDYACPVGTPVFAAASGTVTKIQTDPDGYGLHVRLTHPWGRTIYAHLSEVTCRLGQIAPAGALIARSGDSGFSDCPHLHFEVRRNGLEANGFNGALDPLPLFSQPLASTGSAGDGAGAEGPVEAPVASLASTGSTGGGAGAEGTVEAPDPPHAVSSLYEKQPQRIQVLVAQLILRCEPMRRAQKAGMLFQGVQADVLGMSCDEDGTPWYQVLRPSGWVASRAEQRDLVVGIDVR